MKMSNSVGILFVDSKRMRALLHDCTASTIESIKGTLAQLARRSCQAALEQASPHQGLAMHLGFPDSGAWGGVHRAETRP